MRLERTPAEVRILERLAPVLTTNNILSFTVRDDIVDSPDIVVTHDAGTLGVEVMRLDYEKYCKWRSQSKVPPYSRVAEVTVNLRKLLKHAMDLKRDKYQKYLQQRHMQECWLVLHNDVFDFAETDTEGVPSRRWFEEHAACELQELSCPFDKVLFNLEHPNRWYCLYDRSQIRVRRSYITRWPTVILREVAIVTKRGVNVVDLSDAIPRSKFE